MTEQEQKPTQNKQPIRYQQYVVPSYSPSGTIYKLETRPIYQQQQQDPRLNQEVQKQLKKANDLYQKYGPLYDEFYDILDKIDNNEIPTKEQIVNLLNKLPDIDEFKDIARELRAKLNRYY